MLKTIGSQLKF